MQTRAWAYSAKLRVMGETGNPHTDKVTSKIAEEIGDAHAKIAKECAGTDDGMDRMIQRMLELFIEDMGKHMQAIDLNRNTLTDPSGDSTDAAFERGFGALPVDECPYIKGSKQAEAWNAGRRANA